MAYRRRQGMSRATTFKEEIYHKPEDDKNGDVKSSKTLKPSRTFNSSSSLAARAIRASVAHRESSLSSAYSGDSVSPRSKVIDAYEVSSEKCDHKGFWGILAKKAKSILDDDDDDMSQQLESSPPSSRFQMSDTTTSAQTQQPNLRPQLKKVKSPTIIKGLNKISSSLNQIGDSFEKAFEEGLTIMENKTANIIHETRKLQIRRRGGNAEEQNETVGVSTSWQQPMMQPNQPLNQMDHETQLKASRDVAMATAAKAKLLLRELKTVKADLAFAKQRCSQLEEESKILRDSREKGGNPDDDDLIRLQLETLLAEKARLAHENSTFARENRFLREIVEYHQLTMQDVVYVDECSEEVTEVYPITKMLSITSPTPISPPSPSEATSSPSMSVTKTILPVPVPKQERLLASTSDASATKLEEKNTQSSAAKKGNDAKDNAVNKGEGETGNEVLKQNERTNTESST